MHALPRETSERVGFERPAGITSRLSTVGFGGPNTARTLRRTDVHVTIRSSGSNEFNGLSGRGTSSWSHAWRCALPRTGPRFGEPFGGFVNCDRSRDRQESKLSDPRLKSSGAHRCRWVGHRRDHRFDRPEVSGMTDDGQSGTVAFWRKGDA